MARRARIAAVVATTAVLMTTTIVGVAAINQAVSASGTSNVVSAEAAGQTPVPLVELTSVLPPLDNQPALPSIKKLLKSIPSTAPVAPVVVQAPAAQQAPAQQAPAKAASGEREGDEHEGDERESGEHESDD
jgi:hypothetical protein